jgi:hypothetical protein
MNLRLVVQFAGLTNLSGFNPFHHNKFGVMPNDKIAKLYFPGNVFGDEE